MAKLCPFRKASWVPTPPDPDPEDPTFDPEDGSWLWVTRPPYNATGNGSTDDRAAIQACINAAASQGKGVYFPAGTYHMLASSGTGLTIPSNVALRGVGDTSVVQLYDDGTDDRNILLSLAAGTSNIAVKNLKLTGTQTNKEASVQLIITRGTNGLTVQGVTFDKGEYAFRNIYDGTRSYNILVDDCETLSGVLNPFYTAYVDGMEVKNCVLDCNSVDCMPGRWPHHFYIAGGTDNLNVHDCVFKNGQHWSVNIGESSTITGTLTFTRITMTDIYAALNVNGYNGTCVFDNIQGASSRMAAEAWLFMYQCQGVTLKNSILNGPTDKRVWLVDASNGSSGNTIRDTAVRYSGYFSATPKSFHASYSPATIPTYDNVTVSETGSGGTVVDYTP